MGCPRRFTFTKLVERFLKNYSGRTGSVESYTQRLASPLIAFADKTADELTPQDVDRFRKDREAAVSPTTVRQDLVALSSMYRWATARKLVKENPADPMLVKRPPKGRPDPHPLTAGEVVLLLDALPDYRGELLSMNWRRHVDGDGGRRWRRSDRSASFVQIGRYQGVLRTRGSAALLRVVGPRPNFRDDCGRRSYEAISR